MSSTRMAIVALAAFAGVMGAVSPSCAATDVVDAPTSFFLPVGANFSDPPYYRGASEDWGWTHGGIASGFSLATLNIGAYDVDSAFGEVDNIYAYDNGVRTLLGSLQGIDNDYSYTTFVLGSNFYDDIVSGLRVDVDIDSTNAGWLLTLSKSVVATDGSTLPPVIPGGVPEPGTWALMIVGFGAIGGAMRRRTALPALA